MLINGRHLILANAGDSRAIIINQFGKHRQLTIDQKLDVAEERQRILASGGKIVMTRSSAKLFTFHN